MNLRETPIYQHDLAVKNGSYTMANAEVWARAALTQLAQPYIEGHYDPENGVEIEAGHIALPDGTGLGIIPDEEQFGAPVASF